MDVLAGFLSSAECAARITHLDHLVTTVVACVFVARMMTIDESHDARLCAPGDGSAWTI